MVKVAKKRSRKVVESDCETNSSDEELQEAFAAGRLKTGLNVPYEQEVIPKKNDTASLKKKLIELKQTLPWIERLDIVNPPAPMAPELALQLQTQADARAKQAKGNKKLPQYKPGEDPVLNDFKRETTFHRQAQAAVIDAISRIKKLGIPTIRPDDYFAEMVKTDEHMHKVRENLAKKQVAAQRSEKVRQLRQQRKVGKQMQIEATLKKHADKKQVLDELKKFRKGVRKDLDFLDDKKKPVVSKNKKMKDSKFGFGGKKRGSKLNTRESAADMSEWRKPGRPGGRGGKNTSGGRGKPGSKPGGGRNSTGGKGAKSASRPGKNRRVNMKSKKK
ncbi:hypothetical protein HCN44_003582 [Aphidius gifuensis]|uniref:Uncharacterized protein n=1 Tax=Aphidius gifuensis TaxID=684658 RepID=A0A835CKE0_APHGI|nr:probable rRNA-processing protein EBP2 homolog [Aphidius gifuensis]KAF7987719.1 hypothetical protein HCN44_003582 [Aphidius gifuensis]